MIQIPGPLTQQQENRAAHDGEVTKSEEEEKKDDSWVGNTPISNCNIFKGWSGAGSQTHLERSSEYAHAQTQKGAF